MKYLKSWKLFEFKEVEPNTLLLFKSDNLEIIVVKSFNACKKQGKNTIWCSNMPSGFYKHNMTSNMYRFNFKDGYKLRLTWDYIDYSASTDKYSGGTHWGSGGKVNGEKIRYDYIRPQDESEPFLFDYHKNDHRQEMVNRINSIPQEAINKVHEYQNKLSKEKSELVSDMYHEISKIKVIDVTKHNHINLSIKIIYSEKNYIIDALMVNNGFFFKYPTDFKKDFKNKYAFYDTYQTLKKYLTDKVNSVTNTKNK